MNKCPVHNINPKKAEIGNGEQAMHCPECENDRLAGMRELLKYRQADITKPDDWEPFKS